MTGGKKQAQSEKRRTKTFIFLSILSIIFLLVCFSVTPISSFAGYWKKTSPEGNPPCPGSGADPACGPGDGTGSGSGGTGSGGTGAGTGTGGVGTGAGAGSGGGGGTGGGGGGTGSGGTSGICFIAGTQIAMADGSSKNIEDVKVGDLVVSYDAKTQSFEKQPVLRVDSPIHDDMVQIQFENGITNTNTFDHPYLTKSKGWSSYKPNLTFEHYGLEVSQLKVGDVVYRYNGKTANEIKILEIKEKIGSVQTYNLSKVKKTHTYIANGIVVHNKDVCQDDCQVGDCSNPGGERPSSNSTISNCHWEIQNTAWRTSCRCRCRTQIQECRKGGCNNLNQRICYFTDSRRGDWTFEDALCGSRPPECDAQPTQCPSGWSATRPSCPMRKQCNRFGRCETTHPSMMSTLADGTRCYKCTLSSDEIHCQNNNECQ